MNPCPGAVTGIRLALVLLVLAGCGGEVAPVVQPTTSTGMASRSEGATGDRVRALGTVQPAQQLKLSFLVGGAVHFTKVQVGSEVRAGDLLAVLETADLQWAVKEARDALAVSRALLSQAQAGPSEEAVALAVAQYNQVQDQYQRALAHEAQARALYERDMSQIHPEQVAIAQAEYRAALARYEQVRAGASREALAVARVQVQKAEVALQRAQAAYDRVAGRPDVGASPEAAALQEATLDYELATAQYERLKQLPGRAELGEAEAQVARAAAELRLARIEPLPAQREAIAGAPAVAQAQLDLVRADPRPEDVAVAQAQVRQAYTTLARAELALNQAELRAPFDGIVSAVYLQAGEWAAPGAPVVELLDTQGWLVETRNIGELSIGRVQAGQEAIVRLMAFGGEALAGRVIAISPIAVVQQGDTTYTVLIELEDTDLNLRPGMNAEVEILTE